MHKKNMLYEKINNFNINIKEKRTRTSKKSKSGKQKIMASES